MDYEEFRKFLMRECQYEVMYSDSEGRDILVIRVLDAYVMTHKVNNQPNGVKHVND